MTTFRMLRAGAVPGRRRTASTRLEKIVAGAGWAVTHRAYSRHHLAGYARMAAIRSRYPSVVFEGPVFIADDVEIYSHEGYGRVIVGAYCHFAEGVRIRCHEGTLRIGPKTVFAMRSTVNTWLDIEIGAACLIGDGVYICDFDHRTDRLDRPIKDQGIVKSPVHIGNDVWLGAKTTVTRGTWVGDGCVAGAHAVLRGSYPERAVLVGVPARVVRIRAEP